MAPQASAPVWAVALQVSAPVWVSLLYQPDGAEIGAVRLNVDLPQPRWHP